MSKNYYLISAPSSIIERIWHYCNYQGHSIVMYRTRISFSHVGWVVEFDDSDPLQSLFLLQWSSWVSAIAEPYYV